MSRDADESLAGAEAGRSGAREVEMLGRLDAALGELGSLQAWQQEVETLEIALAELRERSAEQARRSAAEHAAQLLGLQQRAGNERDALHLAHAERLRELQQEATRTRESIEASYQGLLDAARGDAAQAREEAARAREQRDRNAREAEALDAQLGAERVRRIETEAALAALREELAAARAAAAEAEAQRAAEQAARAAGELRLAARDVEQVHARDLIDALSTHAAALAAEQAAALDAERAARREAERRAAEVLAAQVKAGPAPAAAPEEATVQPAGHVDELLALEGARFVATAYATLLGRAPDAAGLETYLRHLCEGITKAEILRSMAASEEGRRVGATLPGLAELVARERPQPLGWLGRLYLRAERSANQPAGREPAIVAAQNRLGLLQERLDSQLKNLDGQLALLHQAGHRQLDADRRLLAVEQALRDLGVGLRSAQATEARLQVVEQRLEELAGLPRGFEDAVRSLHEATAAAQALAPAPLAPQAAQPTEVPAGPAPATPVAAQESKAAATEPVSEPPALPAAAVIERARRLLRRQRGRST